MRSSHAGSSALLIRCVAIQQGLPIDGPTGQFFRQDGDPITAREALDGQDCNDQDIGKLPQQDHENSIDRGMGF